MYILKPKQGIDTPKVCVVCGSTEGHVEQKKQDDGSILQTESWYFPDKPFYFGPFCSLGCANAWDGTLLPKHVGWAFGGIARASALVHGIAAGYYHLGSEEEGAFFVKDHNKLLAIPCTEHPDLDGSVACLERAPHAVSLEQCHFVTCTRCGKKNRVSVELEHPVCGSCEGPL